MKKNTKNKTAQILVTGLLAATSLSSLADEQSIETNFIDRFSTILHKPISDSKLFDLLNDQNPLSNKITFKGNQLLLDDKVLVDLNHREGQTPNFMKFQHTTDGVLIEFGRLDTKGNYVSEVDNGIAKTRLFVSTNGRQKLVSFYSEQGELINVRQGYAVVLQEFDPEFRLVSERYLDYKQQPVFSIDGYHHKKFMYREDGKVLAVYYLGIDGQPVVANQGIASTNYFYSPSHKVASVENRDAYGELLGRCRLSHDVSNQGTLIKRDVEFNQRVDTHSTQLLEQVVISSK